MDSFIRIQKPDIKCLCHKGREYDLRETEEIIHENQKSLRPINELGGEWA